MSGNKWVGSEAIFAVGAALAAQWRLKSPPHHYLNCELNSYKISLLNRAAAFHHWLSIRSRPPLTKAAMIFCETRYNPYRTKPINP